MSKKRLIINILAIGLLVGCGGSSSAPTPDASSIVAFAPPATDITAVATDVTTMGTCGTLPGQWKFNDIATGNASTFQAPQPSAFKTAFKKSWGGTTTAYAIWEIESGDEPVWNEGRTIHVGSTLSFSVTGMVRSIVLTGAPANMTALIGTDNGLEIVDMTRGNDQKWKITKQTSVDAMGSVRSVALATQLIMEKNGPHVPMVFLVANDAVLLAKLDDLRAGFGCMSVAYQAKDHLVNPSDPANKRTFRPIKVVAQNSFASFLTASRLAEEFADAAQLKDVLQKEWESFQGTAYLIDITRQTPVSPFITTMGSFDRFFASDIAMNDTSVYLMGTRYNSAKSFVVESGIAVYKQLIGNPVVNSWAGVPAKLGGDFRLSKFDTNLANAYIRGLDVAAKVEDFLSGPTQQKWTAWPNALEFDDVRSVAFRLDDKGEHAVEVPRFAPSGSTSLNWDKKTIDTTSYAANATLVNATSTDVDYLDVTGSVVHQNLMDDGTAVFPVLEDSNDNSLHSNHPRLFHIGSYLFYVRHGDNGPSVRIFNDTLGGSINLTEKGQALLGFRLLNMGKSTIPANKSFYNTAVAALSNTAAPLTQYRVDDIRMISNPNLPNLQHFAMLVHYWDGAKNNYRVVILQADLSSNDISQRSVDVQGCSDGFDPANNYSGNSSYGNPDEQPRFIAPLTVTSGAQGSVTYNGFFQHYSVTNNVWSVSITTSSDVMPGKSQCESAGELVPVTDPVSAESLSATLNGSSLLGLTSNGLVKWVLDTNTTQYLDIGNNYLGNALSLESGKIVPAGSQFITQMDTIDGFHPTVLFPLNGIGGESCPSCQFTDISSSGSLVLTANPERGVELYQF